MFEKTKNEDYMGMVSWSRLSGGARPMFGTEIKTANEKNQNIEIQKSEKITTNTNDSSENIQLEILPKIENIVCTVNLCCKLNLREIALQARNAEYNPKNFSFIINIFN